MRGATARRRPTRIYRRGRIVSPPPPMDRTSDLAQGGEAWLAARRGRITGSKAAGILGLNPFETIEETANKVLGNSTFRGNDSTAWGRVHEAASQVEVVAHCGGATVEETGLHLVSEALLRSTLAAPPPDHPDRAAFDRFVATGGVGASPDGLVHDPNAAPGFRDGVLELKTPAKGINAHGLQRQKLYWAQVQLEMLACDRRTWALFGVVTPLDVRVERVPWCGSVVVTPRELAAAGLTNADIAAYAACGVYDEATGTCPGIHRLLLRVLYSFWRAVQPDCAASMGAPRAWDTWRLGGARGPADPTAVGSPPTYHEWPGMISAQRWVRAVLARTAAEAKVVYAGAPRRRLVPVPRYRPRTSGFCGWPYVVAWQRSYCDAIGRAAPRKAEMHRWCVVTLEGSGDSGGDPPVKVVSARQALRACGVPWRDKWFGDGGDGNGDGDGGAVWYVDVFDHARRKRNGFPYRHALDIPTENEAHDVRYWTFQRQRCLPSVGTYVATCRRGAAVVHQTVGRWALPPQSAGGGPATIMADLVRGVADLEVDAAHRQVTLRRRRRHRPAAPSDPRARIDGTENPSPRKKPKRSEAEAPSR